MRGSRSALSRTEHARSAALMQVNAPDVVMVEKTAALAWLHLAGHDSCTATLQEPPDHLCTVLSVSNCA